MNDGLLGTLERFEGAADEVFAGLGEDFDGYIVGNVAAFDEAAYETKFGFGSGREGDFDLLEADVAERFEHAHFLFRIHWLEKRLITIAEVGAHPDRRLRDGVAWPVAVDEVYRRKSVVLGGWVAHHGAAPEDWIRWENFKELQPAGACVL